MDSEILSARCGVPFGFGDPLGMNPPGAALSGNPADFFACCGLLELAARRNPEARGRVLPDGRFELTGAPVPSHALLLELGAPGPDVPEGDYLAHAAERLKDRVRIAAKELNAAQSRLTAHLDAQHAKSADAKKPRKPDPLEELKSVKPTPSKAGDLRAALRAAALKWPDGSRTGWWLDTDPGVVPIDPLDPTGYTDPDPDAVEELRLPDVRSLKTWGGQTVIADKVRSLLAAVSAASDAGLDVADLFEFRAAAETPPLFFDSDIKARAIDIGFNPDALGIAQVGRPAVEVLALIGLETCRPVESAEKGVYHYWPWPKPLTATEARAWLGGWAHDRRHQPMAFRLEWRNEYLKSWGIAVPT